MKVFGAGIILFLSVVTGVRLERCASLGIKVLEALCDLISDIAINIETFATPLDMITSEYRNSVLDAYPFGETLRRDGIVAAVNEHSLPLSYRVQLELEEYAHGAGLSYRDGELGRCELCRKRLGEYLDEEKREFERTRRLYRYLPPLAGAALVLFLM